MKKIVLFTHSSYSHNKAIIPFIKELKKKNVELHVFVDKEVINLYVNEGIEVILYPDEIKYDIENSVKLNALENIHRIYENIEEQNAYNYIYNISNYNIKTNRIFAKNITEIVKKIEPDLIIRDTCAFFGKIIGSMLDVKVIGYLCNLAFTKEIIFQNHTNDLMQAWNINSKYMTREKIISVFDSIEEDINNLYKDMPYFNITYMLDPREEINLIFSSMELQPKLDDNSYKVVRYHLFDNDIPIKEDMKEKIIYVSTGTLESAGIFFYFDIIEAFRDSEFKVIIAHPNPSELTERFIIPENVTIERFVDQKEVLKEASLFISHGGYNSICESIYYEVPLIIYPLSKDQFFNATIVEKVGIGVDARRFNLNYINISKIADVLINNDGVRDNLLNLKKNFMNSMNLENIIEDIIIL